MDNNLNSIEFQLTELCCSVIEKLDMLKEKGLISEDQYKYHTVMKKKFLNEVISKQHEKERSETIVV